MSDEMRESGSDDENTPGEERPAPGYTGRHSSDVDTDAEPPELAEGDDDAFDPAAFDPDDHVGTVDPDESHVADAVHEFWEMVRPVAGMAKTGVVTGVLASETVPPPAWSFGDDPEMADTLLDLVLDGSKTATSSAAWDYEDAGEPVPQAGELSILLDGTGRPEALIRTTSVETIPFDEVGEDVAEAEGEGEGTLESWRTEHEAFWRRELGEGREFGADMPVVVERFEVLYPKPSKGKPAQ